jgi:hypothetical protein
VLRTPCLFYVNIQIRRCRLYFTAEAPGSSPRLFLWHPWWTEWPCDRYFSEYFPFFSCRYNSTIAPYSSLATGHTGYKCGNLPQSKAVSVFPERWIEKNFNLCFCIKGLSHAREVQCKSTQRVRFSFWTAWWGMWERGLSSWSRIIFYVSPLLSQLQVLVWSSYMFALLPTISRNKDRKERATPLFAGQSTVTLACTLSLLCHHTQRKPSDEVLLTRTDSYPLCCRRLMPAVYCL